MSMTKEFGLGIVHKGGYFVIKDIKLRPDQFIDKYGSILKGRSLQTAWMHYCIARNKYLYQHITINLVADEKAV